MILIKPNEINSRLLSGTLTLLLSPAKSTMRITPGTLSRKKSKDGPFPDGLAIVRTVEGMNEELDVRESNIESQLREFIVEDPDEFVARTRMKRPLS